MKRIVIPNFTWCGAKPLLFVFLAGLAAAAAAQVPYDANCKPVELTYNQKTEEEFLATHPGARFLVMAPINAGCKALNYVRNFGKSDPAFDNSELIDGMTYDLPRQTKFDRFIFELKAKVHSALGTAAKRDMVVTDDGRVAYFERGHLSGGTSAGAMIYEDGTMARGTFDAKYQLSGAGQLITPDGKLRAGEFRSNRLAGQGFIGELDGNRTVLIEGTFDGDTPVGEVIRNYADGSRVRELWENGKMIARGDRAPKGKVPPPIRRPEVELASMASEAPADHFFLVQGSDGKKQWELRCPGQKIVAFGWYQKGQKPLKPKGKSCNAPVQHVQSAPATATLSGHWRSTVRGNVVRIVPRSGGYDVFTVTNNPGQSQYAHFAPAADGSYRFTFPDGKQAIVRVLGKDEHSVTYPSGRTEVFRRM